MCGGGGGGLYNGRGANHILPVQKGMAKNVSAMLKCVCVGGGGGGGGSNIHIVAYTFKDRQHLSARNSLCSLKCYFYN